MTAQLDTLPTQPAPEDFLRGGRKDVWEYYRVSSLFDDGYPKYHSKLIKGQVAAHPIHGAYF